MVKSNIPSKKKKKKQPRHSRRRTIHGLISVRVPILIKCGYNVGIRIRKRAWMSRKTTNTKLWAICLLYSYTPTSNKRFPKPNLQSKEGMRSDRGAFKHEVANIHAVLAPLVLAPKN